MPRITRSWLAAVDFGLGLAVEIPAAALVAAEIGVLLAGIIARAVGAPLTWSDELASILFLWLAMLGAVIALRRGEHMRMTALVRRLPQRRRDFFDALAVAAGLLFLALIMPPAIKWAGNEIDI